MNIENQIPGPGEGGSKLLDSELIRLEKLIEDGLPGRRNAALALFEIHRRRLFKKGFSSFGEYLKKRWNISRSRGYQLLNYAKFIQELSTKVDSSINERQVRNITSTRKLRSDDEIIYKAADYLVSVSDRLDESGKLQLIRFIRMRLDEMELELKGERAGLPEKQ